MKLSHCCSGWEYISKSFVVYSWQFLTSIDQYFSQLYSPISWMPCRLIFSWFYVLKVKNSRLNCISSLYWTCTSFHNNLILRFFRNHFPKVKVNLINLLQNGWIGYNEIGHYVWQTAFSHCVIMGTNDLPLW